MNQLSGIALVILWSSFAWAASWPALPPTPPVPADNPLTSAKIELGKKLFFDPRLSKDGTISCNTCHNVAGSGTDNRAVAVGVDGQRGNRSAPTVWNAAFLSVQFWDGRAATLEDQAKGPLTNPVEMGMPDHASVMARVAAIPGYVTEFQTAFPGPSPLTIDNLAKAIASYERTLITPNGPYDRYVNGDTQAISAQAERGMKLMANVGCIQCHSGAAFAGPPKPFGKGNFEYFPTFTNNKYVAQYKLLEDKGRGDNQWRIPTLRNVALTAPYFHNGSVPTLDEAVRVMAATQLGTSLAEDQVADIVAFLNTLTGEFPQQTLPRLPPTPNGSLVGQTR